MSDKCEIVRDLLPLYAENMVSDGSRRMIEEHLGECSDCAERLAGMKNELPIPAPAAQEDKKRLHRFRLHLLLAILGFPLWLPLLLVAAAVVLTLYVCIWVVDVCVWCLPLSFGAAAACGIPMAVLGAIRGSAGMGVFYAGCVLAGAGLAVLTFFAALWLTRLIVRMTVCCARRIGGRNV